MIIKAIVSGYGGGGNDVNSPSIIAFGNYIGIIEGESNPAFSVSLIADHPNLNQVIDALINLITQDAASRGLTITNNEVLFPELRTL